MTMSPRPQPPLAAVSSSPTTPSAAMAASSSSTRSRKKIKHCRSSLEFLDASASGTDDDESAAVAVASKQTPPPTSPTTSTYTSNSLKRTKNKLAASSSLMMLTPESPGSASASVSSSTTRTAAAGAGASSKTPTKKSHTKRFRGHLHQRLTSSPKIQSNKNRLKVKSLQYDVENNGVTKGGTRRDVAVAATGVSTHHDAANLINTTPKNNTERDNTLLLEKGGMIPSYSPTTSSVRQSGKKRSSKKSLLEMLEKNEDGHNISILGDLNQQEIQHHNPSSTTGISRACTSSSNDRITPKTKSSRGTTNYTHQDSITPNTSYSPLDYRPDTNPQKQSTAKKHGGAVTDGDENEEVEGEDDDTTMLKSYVDQWATKELAAEPTEVDQQQQHSGKLKGGSRNGSREKTTTTRKRERRGEELVDDPSSSVVSSSWDSEHNNADYHAGDDDGFVVEEGGRRGFEGDCKNHSTENNTIGAPAVMKSNQFFDDDIKDDGIHRGEKLDVLPNTKEQLEVEYGRLALLMQDLEHKNQLQKSMQASGAVSEGRNTHVSLPVPLHTTLNNQATRSMATVEVDDDAPTIQRQLQLEYGRLAVLKDELKRKMKMMNGMEKKVMRGDPYTSHDDDSIRPSLTSSATAKGVGGQCENEKLAREYSQLTSLRQELERKMMQSQKIDVAQANQLMTLPTTSKNMACRDDDIELGEMIYQQRMAEQLAGPFERTYEDEEEDESIIDHERYARRRKEMYPPTRDDIMKYDDIHPEKIRRMRPSSSGASKRKKKRKRRFVETITRVIHEESEEEGSSSTGGRHSLNYQYDSPRKYRIRNEDDYYYDDDDISLGERKHKGKRSSDYRKRYPKSLPPAGFRMPKSRGSGKKDPTQPCV